MRPSPISLCLESLQLLALAVKERGSDPQQMVVSLHQEEVEEWHPLLGPAVVLGPEQDREPTQTVLWPQTHPSFLMRMRMFWML